MFHLPQPPHSHLSHEQTNPPRHRGHPSPGCTASGGRWTTLHLPLDRLALVALGRAVTTRHACGRRPSRWPPRLRLCRAALGSSGLHNPQGFVRAPSPSLICAYRCAAEWCLSIMAEQESLRQSATVGFGQLAPFSCPIRSPPSTGCSPCAGK